MHTILANSFHPFYGHVHIAAEYHEDSPNVILDIQQKAVKLKFSILIKGLSLTDQKQYTLIFKMSR
jgi:hypothetical protein